MTDTIAQFQIPPVVKTVTVKCKPADAFRIFTSDIGRWYPLDTYSVRPAVDCRFEKHQGGRLYEIGPDGTETLWAYVLEWNPPESLALAWQARVTDEETQRIDITFIPVDGGTQVQLVHTGWENIKVEPAEWRDRYNGGWNAILERCFHDFANKAT